MHQFFYGMAVASLGLAVVVTFPTPPGAMRPFSGSRTSVMLSHFVRAVIPRSMRLIIRNCRPRARRRNLHHETLQSAGGRHLCGV